MPFARRGRPGLIGTMARTAVVAGTASAVVNRSNDRHAARQQAAYDDQQQQDQMADMQSQINQMNAQQQSAAVPQQAPAPASGNDTMAQLQKLADLKSQGMLTDQEFAAMKAKLLGV